ncbi:MHS family MFS transporter [Rhodococcus sp. WB9]|uniref:MFS transporter n=1 Tax=Rhodococcus sp. WB9 TaxID=2594007 RepID=UPI0011846CC3|nr:MFS transporter [Rhodococcus sp. WB9]QDQ95055.1 MHS family MFS transporter [Rhodococcus sp. WB9]
MTQPPESLHRSPEPPRRKPKNVGPAVVVGTALELFDFYLYASMAALVFGPLFFPSANSTVSTLAAFSTFAVGFLARPLGGIVFGILGDKIGRKAVLSFNLLLMGLASGCIGLIPSYETIGIAAPVLLVLFRIVQGLGAGAEFGSAIAMSYEHADAKSRGRQGAWPAMGVSVGLLASSLAVAAVTSLSDDALYSWGWRIPFLASFVLVALGYWMRRNLPETPDFEKVAAQAQTRKKAQPFRDLLKHHWRGLTVVAVSTIGVNGISYIFKTFSLSYLSEFRDVAANVGAFGISLASAVALVTIPVAGRLCDSTGTRRIMLIGAGCVAGLAFPFFWLLNTDRPVYIWLALILTVGIVQPTLLAASGSFLARQFPPEVRASGLGAGREVSGALAGGLAPLAALTMVSLSPTHSTWGVSLIFIVGAMLIAGAALGDQYRTISISNHTGATESAPAAQ